MYTLQLGKFTQKIGVFSQKTYKKKYQSDNHVLMLYTEKQGQNIFISSKVMTRITHRHSITIVCICLTISM